MEKSQEMQNEVINGNCHEVRRDHSMADFQVQKESKL